MSAYFAKINLIIIAILLCFTLLPCGMAQSGSSVTKIYTNVSGLQFTVDGTTYSGAVTLVWPTGSSHILSVQALTQNGTLSNAVYSFQQWQAGQNSFQLNPITITADPSITAYEAIFAVQYGLNLAFYSCSSPVCTNGPGTIYINGTAYTSSQMLYLNAGATVVLQATPNPGYVFAGWANGANLTVQGFQATLTLNQPVTVTPLFQVARQINLATSPPGLQILADHAVVNTPATMNWGWDSVHSLSPISPQMDLTGNPWVFSSWSDNGAANHAYTVAESLMADTVTANFVAGVPVSVESSPQGLSLSVDGRSNWPSFYFTWGVGEVHTLAAPAQQTDAQNRVWGFASWSNGGTATQSFTVPASGVPLGVRLVATYTPVGHLTVTSSLSGVSMTVNGQACSLPCDIKQPVGTQVTVSAPASVPVGPGSRQDLLGWSNGAGPGILTLTLGADPVAVTANYHLMNSLSTSSNPAGSVAWSLQPASPDGYYDSQTAVAVAVAPLAGYRFRNWTGDLSGTSPSGSVAMTQPRSIQAVLDTIPYLAPGGVSNGAGATPQAGVAPGSVISIFGANLAAATAVGPASPMVQTLAGATVQVGGRLLPLFFVSPGQINAQLPADTALGDTTLTVSCVGQPDVSVKFTVVADAPGLFSQTVNGQQFALAFHADGSPVSTAAPAARGEVVTVYGTGFGPTTTPRPLGLAVPASPALVATDPATAQLGDPAVAIQQMFAVPGQVGVDAIQFPVGDQVASGTNAPLTVTVGGQASNTVLLPVK